VENKERRRQTHPDRWNKLLMIVALSLDTAYFVYISDYDQPRMPTFIKDDNENHVTYVANSQKERKKKS